MGHCEPIGSREAALRYVAPDIFRVAISHNRIVQLENGTVTFHDQASKTGKLGYTTVAAEEFIRRWLPHVRPDRFINVRSYGLLAPTTRHLLEKTRQWLGSGPQGTPTTSPVSKVKEREKMARGPPCGSLLILVQTLQPTPHQPPEPPPATGGFCWTSRSSSAALTMAVRRGFSASRRAIPALVARCLGSGSEFHTRIPGHFPLPPARTEMSPAPGPLLAWEEPVLRKYPRHSHSR